MDISSFYQAFDELVESLSDEQQSEQLTSFIEKFRRFMVAFGEADEKAIDQVLINLEMDPEDSLFQELGKILRNFHNQMYLIREGIPESLGKLAHQDVSDMTGKLKHIISMTDKAANTTLDLSEEVMDQLAQENDTLRESLEKLTKTIESGNIPEEAAETLRDTAANIQATIEKNDALQGKLTDILIAQDYQDLTGQVIQKILNLLKTLEEDLLGLIKKFGKAEQKNQEKTAQEVAMVGPLQDDHKDKSTQNDVDDLLSQFGF